jgi:transposase
MGGATVCLLVAVTPLKNMVQGILRTCEWGRPEAIPFRKVMVPHSRLPNLHVLEEDIMARRSKSRGTRQEQALPTVHAHAAGMDIGSTFHVVAVPPDLSPEPVRTSRSFTDDLHRLADWLVELGVTTVAMESTGMYWMPIFEILEARGLEVLLGNARHVKNVPGRKTDVNDAQWLQQLHQYGLLRGRFHPAQAWAALRAYLRHRDCLWEYAAAHMQPMQKARMQMKLQRHHVVSDLTGVTGRKIVRVIVAGNHDPAALASYRDVRCTASAETVRAALAGHYRREHVFALQQALELYDSYQAKIVACDQEIEATLAAFEDGAEALDALPAARYQTRQANEPKFPVREELFRVLGTDLSQVHGFSAYTALTLIGECGADMSRWPPVKHFTSWLTLAPGNQISGGKVLSAKTRRSSNRAAKTLRLAAVHVGKTQTALGAFYRRLAARVGNAKAVTATARKLAVLFSNALRYGMAYQDPGASYDESQYRHRLLKGLRRRAKELGYDLVETTAVEGVS